MRTNIRVSAVIIVDEKILLINRLHDDKNYYVLPGVAIEDNETPEEAIAREVEEELNLKINNIREIFTLDNVGGYDKSICFLVKNTTGNLAIVGEEKLRATPNNIYILEWIEIGKLSQYNFVPTEVAQRIKELFIV